jgi:hypothetical protein
LACRAIILFLASSTIRSKDVGRFPDELIFDPLHPRHFLAPFASAPRIPRSDARSRAALRARLDQDALEARRTRREHESESERAREGSSASAQAVERQLAAMQKEERMYAREKIDISTWNKLLKTQIKKDQGI